MKIAIEIENVSVYYDQVCALSRINLKVPNKDFLGIIGPNGGGKSTLLKVILGLIKPFSGNIQVFGRPFSQRGGFISYVPQFSKFDRRFPINVTDVILMGTLRRKDSFLQRFTTHDKELAEVLMEQLDVFNLRHRQIGELSGGQLQRVLIARALALKPKILLLDEPTASLDNHSKNQIYSILSELNKEITIILVTHDMGAISSNVKSLACLNQTLYYHGEPELNNKIIRDTYGSSVSLLAHGVPYRVLQDHKEARKC